MRRVMKTILLVGMAVLGLLGSALAYSPGGPVGNNPHPVIGGTAGDTWQVPAIGYGLGADYLAPKNLGEEYRHNTPVVFYAYDANFLGFFGPNGTAAVDSAFTILNNLTNVSSYTTNLIEFPVESRHYNYQAQGLGLLDLKSITLGAMMEQLGLADPVRFCWTLHDRIHVGNVACPAGMEYMVVQRNFDITSSPLNQLQYSPYVNNILYSYQILEGCTGPNPLALASPYSADPLASAFSPVSTFVFGYGSFYDGLTRDDVAGLRYLLQTNNINLETVSPDSIQFSITTNFSTPQVFPPFLNGSTNVVGTTNGGYYIYTGTTNGGIGYGDLAAFLAYSKTNNLANLQAAYPGVIATQVSNSWGWGSNVTYSSYFTNALPGSPYGTPPRFVVVTNYTPTFLFYYYYQFANVFTNHYYTNHSAFWQTTSANAPIGSPYGSAAVTNIAVALTNQIGGDFFVLSPFYTNFCPVDIVSPPILTAQATTNYLTGGTTNTATTSISNSVALVTFYTNYSYVIYPVTCSQTAGATGLYQGIEKIQFVKSTYDSLVGQYFQPITNYYTMTVVSNSQPQFQYFQRIVTQPDYLFSAVDEDTGLTTGHHAILREMTFNQANALPGLAGPGTIGMQKTLFFDKAGPVFYNSSSGGLFNGTAYGGVLNGTPYFTETLGTDLLDGFYDYYFVWASFDATTNAPVVFPNGTSIDTLQNGIMIQLTPAVLPIGYLGWPYTPTTITASGGSFIAPFTWTAVGLPDGLVLSSDGTLSGLPTQSGTFTFILTLTDSLSRSVQWNYSITIQ